MVAGDGNELDPAPPGDFLDQANIPAEVERGHLDHRPHASLVGLAHGRHRLLQQALTVEEFRVRVAQASGIGAHMLVTQGKAQVSRLHWPQHGIYGWHGTPSSYHDAYPSAKLARHLRCAALASRLRDKDRDLSCGPCLVLCV